MNPPTGQAQPCRVMQPATVPNKNFQNSVTMGEPLENNWPQGSERSNPQRTPKGTGGVGREATGVKAEAETGQGNFLIQKIGGNPW